MFRALLVENDGHCVKTLASRMKTYGFATEVVPDLRDARARLLTAPPHIVFVNAHLADTGAADLAHEFKDVDTHFVILTEKSDADASQEAGAPFEKIAKPVETDDLANLIHAVRSRFPMESGKDPLQSEEGHLESDKTDLIIGHSQAMQKVHALIRAVAPTDATVLIQGESGTGKELVANAIHVLSTRNSGPFLAVNCGAFPENLIASELFGHERGSFSGADHQHRGYFERAAGGTLFLDEITEMPPDLQVHLLRILETGTFLRVGGTKELISDTRIIAATNRSPEQAIVDGRLREDLFYRLQVFPIHIPPLRERLGDVHLLAEHFLGLLNQSRGTEKAFSPQALSALKNHDWPGNVRELKNTVERAHLLASGLIDAEHLIFQPARPTDSLINSQALVGRSLEEIEREVILATLQECRGNKKVAAATLGVSLKTLYNRLKLYGDTR